MTCMVVQMPSNKGNITVSGLSYWLPIVHALQHCQQPARGNGRGKGRGEEGGARGGVKREGQGEE